MAELLISIGVLTTVATGVLAVNTYSRRHALNLEDRMKAILALERTMDKLQQGPGTGGQYKEISEPFPDLPNGQIGGYVSIMGDPFSDQGVRLTLSWTDRGGVTRTEYLLSILNLVDEI